MLPPALAAALTVGILGGCASGGGGTPRATTQAAMHCPPGFTVTCEVRKIGRIHHGTFGKNYDSCACVSSDLHSETAPVIPRF
jgi:hypothetical protein